MSLDREETGKRRFAGRAKKKAKSRRRGSRQRVTMVTISEPDPGLSEEPEDTSLDREETRKRRFALWFHITVIVSIGLLSILLISLRFNSPSPWKEGREHLLDELDELTLQGWMLHDKSLYRVSTTKKGWRASREDCQKRKADLVVINSREELVSSLLWMRRERTGVRPLRPLCLGNMAAGTKLRGKKGISLSVTVVDLRAQQ
ncbi:unnamed protein product [Boreogadus saida]